MDLKLPNPRLFLSIIRDAWIGYRMDGASRGGAAIAFYGVFAAGPLLIIVTVATQLVLGPEAARAGTEALLAGAASPGVASAIVDMAGDVDTESIITTGALSLVAMLWASMRGFWHLQATLNLLWGVRATRGPGVAQIVRRRALSMLTVLATGVLMLVVVVGAVASRLWARELGWMPGDAWSDSWIAMGLLWALTAVMYRVLPDARIQWQDVWVGAGVTTALYALGRHGIAWYIDRHATSTLAGAAGSFTVVLLFAYYAANLLLFGAKLTAVYADRMGHGVVPTRFATRVERRDVDSESFL